MIEWEKTTITQLNCSEQKWDKKGERVNERTTNEYHIQCIAGFSYRKTHSQCTATRIKRSHNKLIFSLYIHIYRDRERKRELFISHWELFSAVWCGDNFDRCTCIYMYICNMVVLGKLIVVDDSTSSIKDESQYWQRVFTSKVDKKLHLLGIPTNGTQHIENELKKETTRATAGEIHQEKMQKGVKTNARLKLDRTADQSVKVNAFLRETKKSTATTTYNYFKNNTRALQITKVCMNFMIKGKAAGMPYIHSRRFKNFGCIFCCLESTSTNNNTDTNNNKNDVEITINSSAQ